MIAAQFQPPLDRSSSTSLLTYSRTYLLTYLLTYCQLESKVNEYMSKGDADGDGDISFTEFTSMDLKSRRATRPT